MPTADGVTTHFNWILPADQGSDNTWGVKNNGNWTDCDSKVYTNQQAILAIQGLTSTTTVSALNVTRTASVAAQIKFNNSTAPAGQQLRWMWLENVTPEASGNVGSDLGLNSYDNTGAFLRTNLLVTRSTGNLSFTGAASFSSTLTCSATMACKSAISVTATTASDNSTVLFYNSAGVRQGYVGWINSGDTISLSADGGANIALTSSINLNGNVGGSGSASFASLTTSGSVTANTSVTCHNLNATQGAVVITAGSVNPSPSVSYRNNVGTVCGNTYYNPATDQMIINHQVSGAALIVDGATNFTFNGNIAFKPGGGPWAATSDARIKDVIGEYDAGIEEVTRLRPVAYRYKGADRQFIGLVAQEAETVMPEMVSIGEGVIDGQKVDDLRSLDTTALVFALINCVKQLKAEIEALKAK